MKNQKRTSIFLVTMLIGTCMGWSCSTDFRDAVWGGVLDFVSGTTTDTIDCVLDWDCE